jgi:N-formylglutamate amidohydrolase
MNRPYKGGYILERHGRGYTPWIRMSINQAIYLQQTGDLSEVPDSDRELIATVRRRLLKVLATFAESLD